MVDFNLPELNWNSSQQSIDTMFLDFFNDLGLHQFVSSPTWNNNILDLILSNDPLLQRFYTVISMMQITCPFASSDHNIITFRMNDSTIIFTDTEFD